VRLFVGGLLLVFGLQWLRKAILRAGGQQGLHDERRIFAIELAAAYAASGQRGASRSPRHTSYGTGIHARDLGTRLLDPVSAL